MIRPIHREQQVSITRFCSSSSAAAASCHSIVFVTDGRTGAGSARGKGDQDELDEKRILPREMESCLVPSCWVVVVVSSIHVHTQKN